MATPTDIHPAWSEDPLVELSMDMAERIGDATPAGILTQLSGLLNELEDRFPGVPFSDILADKQAMNGNRVRSIRYALARNGACDADIALVCPPREDSARRRP